MQIKLTRLFLIFASVLLISLQFEFILRINKYTNRDFEWVTRTKPDKIYTIDPELIFKVKPYVKQNRFLTDDLGLINLSNKDEEGKAQKIFIIGDSVVRGNTELNQSMPLYLFKYLLQTGKKFSIYNGGIPGYGTDQEFVLFNKMLKKSKPDLVFWFITTNDIYDNNDRPLFVIKENKLKQIPGFYNGLYLKGVLSKTFPTGLIEKSMLANYVLDSVGKINFYHKTKKNEIINYSLKKMSLIFEEMEKLSNKNKFKVYYVISPRKSIVDKIGNYSFNAQLINNFKQILKNQKIVDMNDVFLRYKTGLGQDVLGISSKSADQFLDESGNFEIDSWHPNEFGNSLMANELVNLILSE